MPDEVEDMDVYRTKNDESLVPEWLSNIREAQAFATGCYMASRDMTNEERLLLRDFYRGILVFGIDKGYIEGLMKVAMNEYMTTSTMVALQEAVGQRKDYKIDGDEGRWTLKEVLKKAYEEWRAEDDRGTAREAK